MWPFTSDEDLAAEAEKRQFYLDIDAERTARQMSNLNATDRAYDQDQAFLESIGEEPLPEPTESFPKRVLNAFMALGEGTRAGLLSGGIPEYADDSFLEAARRGIGEHLTTADILRRSDAKIPFTDAKFADYPVLRGAVGFLGDVVTDPLSYLSFGGTQSEKYANLAISKSPIKTKLGEETASQVFSRVADENSKIFLEQLKQKYPNVALPDWLEGQAKFLGGREATKQFSAAKAIVDQNKKLGRTGVSALAPEEVAATQAQRMSLIDAAEAGLEKQFISVLDPNDLGQLFKPAGIRFSGPFAGMPYLEKIPLLGERELDIPGLSQASEQFYDLLGKTYYGTKVKVFNFFGKGLEENPNSIFYQAANRALDAGVKAHDKTVGALGYVSRRIKASGEVFGSSRPRDQIMQHERDLQALMALEAQNASYIAKDVMAFPDGEEILKDIGRTMSEAAGALKRENADTAPVAFEHAMQSLRSKYALSDPAKGDAAEKLARYFSAEYDRMAKIEQELGVLDNTIDNYVHAAYDWTGVQGEYKAARIQQIKDRISGDTSFTMGKVFSTIDEAKSFGLVPEENALNLFVKRRVAHERVLAERDFLERMAYEHAMPAPVYERLVTLAKDASAEKRKAALNALHSFGLDSTTQMLPLQFRLENGMRVDSKMFDNYADLFSRLDKNSDAYRIATEQVSNFTSKVGIPPEEFFSNPLMKDRVLAAYKVAEDTHTMVPGWYGEKAFTRSGGTTVSEFIKKKMLGNLSAEDKIFWDGVIPRSLAGALEESYETGNLLRKHIEKVDGGLKNPFYKALDSALNFLGSANKALKTGATTLWPAYHTRNLYGAGFQAGEVMTPLEQIGGAVSNLAQAPLEMARAGAKQIDKLTGMDLGKHLNLWTITQSQRVLESGADLVDVYGKTIKASQLQREIIQAGLPWNTQIGVDMVSSMTDMMEQMSRSGAMRGALPNLERFVKEGGGKPLYDATTKWGKVRNALSITDRAWTNYKGFAERLEAFGRTHTFINLRQRGYDFESAAAATNRMMIDYANAKTPFERDVLNKVFFFYSFSRGNMTNQLINLARKPGALTTQLHAINGVAEMLKEPGAFIEEPDAEQAVLNTRLREGLSAYVGTDKDTGKLEFLASTGLPLEDVTKWFGGQGPRNMSLGELISSTGKSAKRTAMLLASNTNPVIREITQLITGHNLFFDRPITDSTLRKVPKWDKDISVLSHLPFRAVPDSVWQGLDKVTQEALGARDNGDGTWSVNPYNYSLLLTLVPAALAAIPGLSTAGTALAHGSRFVTTRKALTDPGIGDGAAVLRGLTGVQIQDVDPETSVVYDRRKRMEDYLTDLGIPKAKRERARILEAYEDDAEDGE